MSEQNVQAANRQLMAATLAAAIIQVRGGANLDEIVEALRDADAALKAFGQERREGRERKQRRGDLPSG